MKIILLTLCMSSSACAPLTNGVQTARNATNNLYGVGDSYFSMECIAAANACVKKNDKTCLPLVDCQARRAEFNKLIISAKTSLAMADSMIAVKKATEAEEALASARFAIEHLYQLLKKNNINLVSPAVVTK